MKPGFQPLHEGAKYRVRNADGTFDLLTPKEYLARRGDFNQTFPLAKVPSPGAGARRDQDPRGRPSARTEPEPEPEAS